MLAAHPALYRYARGLSGDSADADDLVQEAFRRALVASRQPANASLEEVRRWMFVILRNIWKNEKRRQARDFGLPSNESAPAPSMEQSPEATVLRKWLQSEIREALDTLDDVFREVIVLRDLEGMSYAAIAELIECPVGTVMSRIARGRKQLRERLAAHGAGRGKGSRT